MKKEPLFIAFSTQKGGAGKTTLTVLMASYLYYVKGYDVAVVDCDYPQFSIKDMRERDLKSIERNPYLRKLAYDCILFRLRLCISVRQKAGIYDCRGYTCRQDKLYR